MKKANGMTGRGGTKTGAAGASTRKKRRASGRASGASSRGRVGRELGELVLLLDQLGLMGLLPPPETPLDAAEALMTEAWGSESKRHRATLARKALELSPDCVDAHVLLAVEARSPEEARPLLERAVAAGERVLGPRTFKEDVGNFWLLLETRPYMRARELLASCLWALGERQGAIGHYQELLRLNPNDNQGIRYVLARFFLETGQDEALVMLLRVYADDASAVWLYTAALLAFRQKGPTAANEKKLDKALKANPFVPDYLLGRKRLPSRLPDLIGMGDENEAVDYAAVHKAIWERTPHALDWLRYALGGWVLSPEHWKKDPESSGSSSRD